MSHLIHLFHSTTTTSSHQIPQADHSTYVIQKHCHPPKTHCHSGLKLFSSHTISIENVFSTTLQTLTSIYLMPQHQIKTLTLHPTPHHTTQQPTPHNTHQGASDLHLHTLHPHTFTEIHPQHTSSTFHHLPRHHHRGPPLDTRHTGSTLAYRPTTCPCRHSTIT